MIGTMIGRMHHVVLDCPDPDAVAAFYSTLIGMPVTYRDDDWVVVAASDASSGLAFQRAPENPRPTWPDPEIAQQVHLDIMVEDVAVAGPRVLAIGAVKLDGPDVYADPAGHPFCLIRRPPGRRPSIRTPQRPATAHDSESRTRPENVPRRRPSVSAPRSGWA